jgi:sterol desaturase/sphingolipid hydroxylase (fatty acid hydroxylase superfamily)/DNA-binding beta-propeller fold protein YncE
MEWIAAVGDIWLYTLAWLAGLGVAFGVLARLTPCNPGMYWWTDLRAVTADLVYWLIVPLFLQIARLWLLQLGIKFLFAGKDPDFLPVKHLPLWLQCLAILLLQDVILYGLHRAFHSRWIWKFHAVHHSPKVLDWMSAARFHPVNNFFSFVVADVVVLLLGFPARAVLVLIPFNTIYSAMVHANLNWTFGPLRYALASPVFHRWHHTTEAEGLDKNFASTFPFLDLMFGTFYMPQGKMPARFGTGEVHFPEGFLGQFLHPFWRRGAPNPDRPGAGQIPQPAPRPALRAAALILAVVGLVGGGLFVSDLAKQNRQLAEEAGRAKAGQLQAEAALVAFQFNLAVQAWAENDLVRAWSILNQVGGPGKGNPELDHVRDLCRRKCRVLTGHRGAVLGVAVSADGRRIVSGGEDGTVKVWDAATGRERLTLTGHSRPVHCVAISADGKRIVSGSYDRTVKIWDAATGREKFTLTGNTGAVLSVAISADGRRAVAGSSYLTTKVWDAATGRELHTLTGNAGAVPGVAVSADGGRIVTAGWRTAKVWDGKTGQEQRTLPGHADLVYHVAISPDARHIVTGAFDEKVKVWDAATGREELCLTGHKGPVYAVAISPDGKHLISGGKDRTVKVWDAATGREELTLKGHTGDVTSVAASADGRRIVSGSRDGTLKVWDAGQCKQTLPSEGDGISLAGVGPSATTPRHIGLNR